MAESRYAPLKTDKFRVAYEAMRGIASKTLSPEGEMKLALLVKSYEKIFDATTAALKKNETENGRMVGNRLVLTPLGLARRERIIGVTLQIKLPPKEHLIKKGDLPKIDTDAPEKDIDNRQATALLVSQLGPFYDYEATGDKKEMLDTDLDARSLALLEAANSDDISIQSLPADPGAVAKLPADDQLGDETA